jgi:hypothetical protein
VPAEAGLPAPLECLLRRCLEPEREERYPSAAELARALDGCRELRRVEKSLPPAGPLTAALRRWPFALGCLLGLLPHFLGSVVNISYNALQIVSRLTPEQQGAFQRLVLTYNVVVYPLCLVIICRLVLPIRRVRLQLARSEPLPAAMVAQTRRRVLKLPMWCVWVACLGWLPGAFLFPLLLDRFTGPISAEVYGHFLISFTISGLIALTYSFFAMQYLAVRVLYPVLWTDARAVGSAARDELRGVKDRLGWFQLLAVLIPLSAAVLMVGVGGEGLDRAEYRTFRLLVTALIALGMVGLGIAMMVSRRLNETLTALTAGPRR